MRMHGFASLISGWHACPQKRPSNSRPRTATGKRRRAGRSRQGHPATPLPNSLKASRRMRAISSAFARRSTKYSPGRFHSTERRPTSASSRFDREGSNARPATGRSLGGYAAHSSVDSPSVPRTVSTTYKPCFVHSTPIEASARVGGCSCSVASARRLSSGRRPSAVRTRRPPPPRTSPASKAPNA